MGVQWRRCARCRTGRAGATDPLCRRCAALAEGVLPLGLETLTGQQRKVLALAAEGLTNQEIAWRMCISDRTVKNHLTDCYKRLGVSGRVHATRFVWRAEGCG